MFQHVAEIKLGMFASPAALKALQNDPTRWAFGYAKIAGLFLTVFAAARYWAARDGVSALVGSADGDRMVIRR